MDKVNGLEDNMKNKLLIAFVAATAATAVSATAGADEAAATPSARATCRLVTGALIANFGTLSPASVSSRPQAAAMDYRCVGEARARGGKDLPMALYWTLAPAAGGDTGERTVATTYGTGGILGIAQAANEPAGYVSVVVAP